MRHKIVSRDVSRSSRTCAALLSVIALIVVMAFGGTPLVYGGVGKNLSEVGGTGLDLPLTSEDKALVVFFLASKRSGGVHATLADGDEFITHLVKRTCFYYQSVPGYHMFSVVGEAADFLEADLMAGKTYFIQVAPRMGAWKARFSLLPFTEQSGNWDKHDKWLSSCKVVVPTPHAFEWAKEKKEELAVKRKKYFVKWQEKPEAEPASD